jgi:ammonia channel protein AmtB
MNEEDIIKAVNGLWIFTAAVLCFLMQAGFGLLEVGSIRAKNAQNVMLKNLLVRLYIFFSHTHVLVLDMAMNRKSKHRITSYILTCI